MFCFHFKNISFNERELLTCDNNSYFIAAENDQEIERDELEEHENDIDPKKLLSQKYINPIEVRQHVQQVFQKSGDLLRAVFRGSLATEECSLNSIEMFFMDIIAVPPSRFRPVCAHFFMVVIKNTGLQHHICCLIVLAITLIFLTYVMIFPEI